MKHKGNLEKLETFEAYRPSLAARRAAQKRHFEIPETLSRTSLIISWGCCLLAAGIMLETLFFKFTAAPESVYIFNKMGTEPWMRWVQGFWELTASLCLLIPRFKWAGGILTSGAMLAAILSHLTWLGISVKGDNGLLFGMALVTFTCGFTVMILRRHQIPFLTPLSYW